MTTTVNIGKMRVISIINSNNIRLSLWLPACQPVRLFICLFVSLPICWSVIIYLLSVYLRVRLFMCLFVSQPVSLSVCQHVHPSICLFVFLSAICLCGHVCLYVCLFVRLGKSERKRERDRKWQRMWESKSDTERKERKKQKMFESKSHRERRKRKGQKEIENVRK